MSFSSPSSAGASQGAPVRGGAAPSGGGRRPAKGVARRTISVLPTSFTLGNLLAGFFAVFLASRTADPLLPFGWTSLTWAAVLIFFGMLLDGLDGRIARLTRSSSDLGAQLDSMADMVTFGVAPAFLVVQVLRVQTPFLGATDAFDTTFDRFGLVVAAAFVACAGLRLARFNVETNDAEAALRRRRDLAEAAIARGEEPPPPPAPKKSNWFSGLPSPGAAGAVAGLVLLHQHLLARPSRAAQAQAQAEITDPGTPLDPASNADLALAMGVDAAALGLLAATLLCALAMVSRLPYVHVLNRYVRGRAPFGTVALGVVCVLLLTVFPQQAIAAGFVTYALSGPLVALRRRAG